MQIQILVNNLIIKKDYYNIYLTLMVIKVTIIITLYGRGTYYDS